MKITSEKHNHKLTNLLKVFIFSVLMLLPFLNVAVRCGYVMLNKNAYQSAEITQTTYNQTITERLTDDTVKNNYYYYIDEYNFNDINGALNNGNGIIRFTLINGIIIPSNKQNLPSNTNINIYFNFTDGENTISYLDTNIEDDLNAKIRGLVQINDVLDFNNEDLIFLADYFENATSYMESNNMKYIYSYEEVQATTLDNVFEYSLNKLEQEQYLTWTQNTAIYTGVNAMTTGLGITQTVIPMLIVYWFILTIIYIIIDIVLALFTKLTHMIGNKTT